MEIIPTKVHGILDYLTGILLILAPWLFRFADGSAAQWVPIALGAVVIIYSLITDYEFGLVGVIPIPVHLVLDVGGGILLLASPWLFGFSEGIAWPHVTVGLMEVAVAVLTRRHIDAARAEGIQ